MDSSAKPTCPVIFCGCLAEDTKKCLRCCCQVRCAVAFFIVIIWIGLTGAFSYLQWNDEKLGDNAGVIIVSFLQAITAILGFVLLVLLVLRLAFIIKERFDNYRERYVERLP